MPTVPGAPRVTLMDLGGSKMRLGSESRLEWRTSQLPWYVRVFGTAARGAPWRLEPHFSRLKTLGLQRRATRRRAASRIPFSGDSPFARAFGTAFVCPMGLAKVDEHSSTNPEPGGNFNILKSDLIKWPLLAFGEKCRRHSSSSVEKTALSFAAAGPLAALSAPPDRLRTCPVGPPRGRRLKLPTPSKMAQICPNRTHGRSSTIS
mmetsp:Transcript_27959/g.96654  ORF Transcript_27959/g.96654 Transcript_27959/m.96654 type:complete len:205 (+) Transcript_27959:387-1001(+)